MWYTGGTAMRLIWTRLLVVFGVAAFIALPAQPLISTSYLCHMTGKVSADRCCAGQRADICHAQIEAQDCCELMQARGPVTAAATRSHTQDVPVIALLASPAFALHLRVRSATRTRELTLAAAHPLGPPRFLVNCSLLI
jgi:hypothetical protein